MNDNKNNRVEKKETFIVVENENQNIFYSKLYRLYTTLMFISTNLLFKILNNNYNLYYMYHCSTLRYGFMFIFCIIYNYYINKYNNNKNISFIDKTMKFKGKFNLVLSRVFVVNLNMILFTLSLKYLKLGIAVTLNMTTAIIQNILTPLILKEKFNKKYAYICLISFIGVILLCLNKSSNSSKDFKTFDYNLFIGIIIGILNAICVALVYILTKQLQKDYTTNDLNIITSFWIFVFLFFYSISIYNKYNFLFFDTFFVVISIIIGFFTFLAFYFMGLSVKYGDISKTSYITYLQLPILFLIGVLFFSEHYSMLEFLGSFIIFGCVYYAFYYIK